MTKKLRIELTDRPPVVVLAESWPVEASARDWDNQFECQANRRWRMCV